MKLTLINDTSKLPLQKIGQIAGICWASDTTDVEKNKKRAINCIKSDHGRVMEWVNIEFIVEDVSARCMREIGRHCVGTSYLQSSTRYVSEEDGFEFYIPPKVATNVTAKETYVKTMGKIQDGYNNELADGINKEDAANLLPLGMMSTMVWKINLRSLVNFMHKRLCMRALKEIRDFAHEIKSLLRSQNSEWEWIADNLFVPLCEQYKFRNPDLCFCIEERGCGRYTKIEELAIVKPKKDTNNENQTH